MLKGDEKPKATLRNQSQNHKPENAEETEVAEDFGVCNHNPTLSCA
jgi:hypothetical protein